MQKFSFSFFKTKIFFLISVGIFLISSFSFAAMMVPGDPPPEISDVSVKPNKVKVNQTITIKAKVVSEENNNVSFVEAFFPELELFFIKLYDNGISPDEIAGDNIYTNTWTVPENISLGEYQVVIVTAGENSDLAFDYSGKFEVVLGILEQKQKELIEDYFPYWKFSQDEKYYPTSFYFDNDADVENNRENYEAQKENWAKPYVYAHTVEDENYFTIQYWMYMAQNYHWFWENHEHDFDATVFVVFDKNNLDRPIEVRFARHWYIGVYSWNEIGRNNTTHPIAYVAQGSHGAYRCSDMGTLDIFNPGGLTYSPNFFNYYQVGNCVEEIEKEINGEQREFCKVENELIKGNAQNEPADGYWPNKFTGDVPNRPWVKTEAPWHPNQDRWYQTRPNGLNSALEFGVACPVDLHIYDPNGKHIGINYQTNEPEIEIPKAIFSKQGEKQYIMIPNPIKGDYQVKIVGTGNGEYDFIMIASEDMKLIEKKEKKNVPIVKNETQTFVIPSLWESPRKIKQKAVDDLNSIENDNRIIQKNIQKAIGLINKSLDKKYWIDDERLNKKQGIKVFNYGLKAATHLKALKKISKKLKINDSELSSLEIAENRLAKADYLLAEITLNELKNTEIKNDRFKKRIEKLIKKAEKELIKAKKDLENDKPVKSINHSKKSWSYSQMAIRLAEIPDYFKKNK